MPLTIEYVGDAPGSANFAGVPLISVCHYGKQNGDAMRDPEMVFHVIGGTFGTGSSWRWTPRYYRNDYVHVEQEVFVMQNGKPFYKPTLLKQLRSFAAMWDRNIKNQGFLEAYNLGRKERTSGSAA